VSISSDFIVGFPGETDADFDATMKLIDDIKFDGSYNFVYSRRPGTPAADLADDTPEAVKLARVQRLQSVVDEQLQQFSLAMVGTRQRVLVTGPARREGQLSARADNNRVVNFEGPVSLINQFVDVTISEALRYSLRGELTAGAPTVT
jgi:tRNA-2-methylthio-N6-dimethylallyladenosine synthase